MSNYVRGTTNTLELSKAGNAIDLTVYRSNRILGRLKVGRGAVWWIPRGTMERNAKKIPWRVFDEMLREWPFGSPKKGKLTFKKGAVYWKPRGQTGKPRRFSWDEVVERLS